MRREITREDQLRDIVGHPASYVANRKPQTWDPTALPSTAQIAQRLRKDADLAQLEDYYREENQRKLLY